VVFSGFRGFWYFVVVCFVFGNLVWLRVFVCFLVGFGISEVFGWYNTVPGVFVYYNGFVIVCDRLLSVVCAFCGNFVDSREFVEFLGFWCFSAFCGILVFCLFLGCFLGLRGVWVLFWWF